MKPTVRELLDRYIYDPATGDIRYRVRVHVMDSGNLKGAWDGYRQHEGRVRKVRIVKVNH